MFRREDCVGEFRHDDRTLTLGLKRMTMVEAAAAGARTLVLGIAGAGGKLGAELVADAAAALDAGMNVASGLHKAARRAAARRARRASAVCSCSTSATRRQG